MERPTRKHLEMVIAGYQAIARRDFAAMIANVAADGVLETRLGTYERPEGMQRYFEESLPNNMTSVIETIVLTEDRIAVLSVVTIVGPHSQIAASEKVAEVCEFEDGLIKRLTVMGRDQCLDELDLRETASQIETLHSATDCFNRGDIDGATEYMHPEIVWNRGALTVGGDSLHGREAVRELLEPEVFENQNAKVEMIFVRDDRLLVVMTFSARGAASGIEISNTGYQLWTMRDGKGAQLDFFQEREEAFERLFAD